MVVAVTCLGCGTAALEPESAGADFPIQGEYASDALALGAQVVARGGGRFTLHLLEGGLPGAGWNGTRGPVLRGAWSGPVVQFGEGAELRIRDGRLEGTGPEGRRLDLVRIERQSPTLGAAPPPGAVVLFDGSGPGGFDGEVDERGFLQAGATSREPYGSFDLHVEFRTPFMPTADGQSRGNSGIYLQGRYEVQILDSFGEPATNNLCGALYEFRAPDLPMAFPPLQWQTYDIEFRTARFAPSRDKTHPAVVTVRHNGVVVHDSVELEGPTGRGLEEGPAPGLLILQDHWDPVVFRNVWFVPR